MIRLESPYIFMFKTFHPLGEGPQCHQSRRTYSIDTTEMTFDCSTSTLIISERGKYSYRADAGHERRSWRLWTRQGQRSLRATLPQISRTQWTRWPHIQSEPWTHCISASKLSQNIIFARNWNSRLFIKKKHEISSRSKLMHILGTQSKRGGRK